VTTEFENLRVEVDGGLGRITLDRPERLNALSPATLHELREAAHWFDARPEVRVVVLCGEGRAFTAGADLTDPPGASASPESGLPWHERREAGQIGLRTIDALEGMRAVTVAQLHGYVIGGGVLLAAACDMRVAADDTVFSIPEVDIGIPLAWGGIPRLVREIGPALTKELVITCRRFSAEEARSFGFLNRVVPAAQLESEVKALVDSVLDKPSVPVTITKEHVNSVARSMAAGSTSFSDGDALMGVLTDPEYRKAAKRYKDRTIHRKK